MFCSCWKYSQYFCEKYLITSFLDFMKIAKHLSGQFCMFACFCENTNVFEKTVSLRRISVCRKPVVVLWFQAVLCSFISTDHVLTTSKYYCYMEKKKTKQKTSKQNQTCNALTGFFWHTENVGIRIGIFFCAQ